MKHLVKNNPTEIAMWSDEIQVDGINCRQAIWLIRTLHSSGGMWWYSWRMKSRYLRFSNQEKRPLQKIEFHTKQQAMQWIRKEGIFKEALREIGTKGKED